MPANGRPMVKNVVALGALQSALNLLPEDSLVGTLRHVLHDKPALLPLNESAYAAGQRAVHAGDGSSQIADRKLEPTAVAPAHG